MKSVEAIYCVPDEEPVVQLFHPNGGQWGEIRRRAARLEIEMFPPSGQSSWTVDADELAHVIDLARQRLSSTESEPGG